MCHTIQNFKNSIRKLFSNIHCFLFDISAEELFVDRNLTLITENPDGPSKPKIEDDNYPIINPFPIIRAIIED